MTTAPRWTIMTPMSTYTHQVTVKAEVSTYEQELAETKATMAGFLARGSWSQEEVDYAIQRSEQRLAEAQTQERYVLSKHKSLSGAQRGLKQAQEHPRFKEAQIEEIAQ